MRHVFTTIALAFSAAVFSTFVTVGGSTAGHAADLLRHRHHSYRATSERIFSGDERCPRYEPADYKPRITNFNEPGCYAARPYGLSSTLYDYPLDLRTPHND